MCAAEETSGYYTAWFSLLAVCAESCASRLYFAIDSNIVELKRDGKSFEMVTQQLTTNSIALVLGVSIFLWLNNLRVMIKT